MSSTIDELRRIVTRGKFSEEDTEALADCMERIGDDLKYLAELEECHKCHQCYQLVQDMNDYSYTDAGFIDSIDVEDDVNDDDALVSFEELHAKKYIDYLRHRCSIGEQVTAKLVEASIHSSPSLALSSFYEALRLSRPLMTPECAALTSVSVEEE